MKNKSSVYHFITALLVLSVFIMAVLPSSLLSSNTAKELHSIWSGDMIFCGTSDINSSHCCCQSQEEPQTVKKTVTREGMAAHELTIKCFCGNRQEAPIDHKAVSTLQILSLKMFAFPNWRYVQLVPAFPLFSFTEPSFFRYSDSSPPIYLKNSIFLN